MDNKYIINVANVNRNDIITKNNCNHIKRLEHINSLVNNSAIYAKRTDKQLSLGNKKCSKCNKYTYLRRIYDDKNDTTYCNKCSSEHKIKGIYCGVDKYKKVINISRLPKCIGNIVIIIYSYEYTTRLDNLTIKNRDETKDKISSFNNSKHSRKLLIIEDFNNVYYHLPLFENISDVVVFGTVDSVKKIGHKIKGDFKMWKY